MTVKCSGHRLRKFSWKPDPAKNVRETAAPAQICKKTWPLRKRKRSRAKDRGTLCTRPTQGRKAGKQARKHGSKTMKRKQGSAEKQACVGRQAQTAKERTRCKQEGDGHQPETRTANWPERIRSVWVLSTLGCPPPPRRRTCLNAVNTHRTAYSVIQLPTFIIHCSLVLLT